MSREPKPIRWKTLLVLLALALGLGTLYRFTELGKKPVHTDEAIGDYLIRIIRGTRELGGVLLGASPRAAISLMSAAKANAFLQERDYVIPDDIKALAPAVLSHRIMLQTEARMNGLTPDEVVDSVVRATSVPVRMER